MIATMSLSCTVSIADAGQGGPGGRPTTMGPPTSTTPRYGPPTTLPPDYCPLAGFCQNFDAMDVIDNTIYVFKGVTSCECWLLINFWLNFKTCRKTRKSVLYLVLYLCILQLRSYIFFRYYWDINRTLTKVMCFIIRRPLFTSTWRFFSICLHSRPT